MTKPRPVDGKPIEVTFTPCDLDPKDGTVPVLKTLGFHELMRHQTEEVDRVGRELIERSETFFQDYCVARTGDDLPDFLNLALQMATELFPHFRFRDDPDLLDLLFPLYGLLPGKGGVDAYRLLICRMAESEGFLRIVKQPYKHKPSNRLALIQLLADADAVKLKWPRLRSSDRNTAKHLIEREPFKARWGDMDWRTLRNWFTAARSLFKRPKRPSECPENR